MMIAILLFLLGPSERRSGLGILMTCGWYLAENQHRFKSHASGAIPAVYTGGFVKAWA